MKTLVTGGAGFIGSHLAEALLRRGETVRVVDNLSTGQRRNLETLLATGGDLDVIEGDLLDPECLRRACRGVEIVFHLAALPSVQRSVEFPVSSHQVNANGTLLLLDAARAAGVRRFIYSASSSAYGNSPDDPDGSRAKLETMEPRPLSPYAVSKLAGEHYTRVYAEVYGMETISLRYFNVFGPRQSPRSAYGAAIPKFAAALLEGRRPLVFGDGLQSRDFTFVENAIRANLRAAEVTGTAISGEVVNIACGSNATLLDIIGELNRIIGTHIEPQFAPGRLADVRHSRADISKACRLLGYEIEVSLSEGLRRTVEAIRAGL